MNELKNRGVEDILIAVVDGLRGFPKVINAVFRRRSCRPASSISSEIPWILRRGKIASRSPPNSKRSTGGKTRTWPRALEDFDAGVWGRKYPSIAQSWRRNWEHVIPFFAFPEAVRRIIYTTNAIESLNAKLRRAVRTRGHFPTDEAAMKLLYLVLRQVAENGKRRRANGVRRRPNSPSCSTKGSSQRDG